MFDSLIGNAQVKQRFARMLNSRRLPGSMLFTGESGIGKKLFAFEIARALNCHSRNGVDACGKCAVCARVSRLNFPSASAKDAKDSIVWSDFPDVGLVRPFPRLITVPVIRALEREANFRPFEGNTRVFIIDDADRMNEAASNALLKTLEEPAPTTYIILVTDKPASLMPTIRSRCQLIRFSPVPRADIAEFLVKQRGMSEKEATLAACLGQGSIARAMSIKLEEFKEQRAFLLDAVRGIAIGGDRVKALRCSEYLNDPKQKEQFDMLLNLFGTLIHDVWLLLEGADTSDIVNSDIASDLQDVAKATHCRNLGGWLRQIEVYKRGFEVNINKKPATDALLMSMMAGA